MFLPGSGDAKKDAGEKSGSADAENRREKGEMTPQLFLLKTAGESCKITWLSESQLTGGKDMEQNDIQLLVEWLEDNKDHKIGLLEREAIKVALHQAKTVGDLANLAVKLVKGQK